MTNIAQIPGLIASRVAIIIVNYKSAALTTACLESLQSEISDGDSFHVIVVDNNSGDGDQLSRVLADRGWNSWASLLIAERNGGFSYGNNRGIEHARLIEPPPEYFFLLNPDTEVRHRAIRELVDFMDANPTVGITGSSFENQDGVEWPYAFRFFSIASEFERTIRLGIVSRILKHRRATRNMHGSQESVDWVSGASMMIRRQVLEDIGLLDEGYFLYYEEVDFCLRSRRTGWPCWYVPSSRVMHISGQTTGVSSNNAKIKPMPSYWFESRTRYFVKNHGLWYARLADAAYGLGLSLYKLRAKFSRRTDPDPRNLLMDFWRHSVIFRRSREVLKKMTRR